MQTVSVSLSQLDNFRNFLKTLEPTGVIYPTAFNEALSEGTVKLKPLPPNYDLKTCVGASNQPNTLCRFPISVGHSTSAQVKNSVNIVYERITLTHLKNSLKDGKIYICLPDSATSTMFVKAVKEAVGLTIGNVGIGSDPTLVTDWSKPFEIRTFITIPEGDYIYLPGTLVFEVVNTKKKPNPNPNVGAVTAYEIWISEGNVGSITDFLESLKGEPGAQGLSAYEVWLEYGNIGTYNDYIEALRGPKGERGFRGTMGPRGLDGPPGTAGKPGKDGKSAYQVWLDLGNRGTEADYQTALKGANGKSAYQSWLSTGHTGTEQDFVTSLKGKTGNPGLNAYELAVSNGFNGSLEDWLKTNPMNLELVPMYDVNNKFLGNIIGGAPGGGTLQPGSSEFWVSPDVIEELKLKHGVTEPTDTIYGLLSLLLTVVNK